MSTLTIEDITSDESIWVLRHNGMIVDKLSGDKISEDLDIKTIRSTTCEFIVKSKTEKLDDYSFNYIDNGYKNGINKPTFKADELAREAVGL